MKKKPIRLALVVLYGICAALWLVLCAREFMASGSAAGLKVFATVVWTAGFFVLLAQYRNQ